MTVAVDVEDADPEDCGSDVEASDSTVVIRFSPHEILRHKDFAAYTQAEFEEARRLMADLRVAGALRRTVRRSMTAGGEPIRRAFLKQERRPRRVILICDVSGSMEPYSRALLRFLHAAVVGRTQIEALALGTRLTRVHPGTVVQGPGRRPPQAARAGPDWSAGPASVRECRFSTTHGVCGEWREAPSSWSSRTAGIAANPSCWRSKCSASPVWPTRSSGSTH